MPHLSPAPQSLAARLSLSKTRRHSGTFLSAKRMRSFAEPQRSIAYFPLIGNGAVFWAGIFRDPFQVPY